MSLLVNETMQQAQPVSELGRDDLPGRRRRNWPTGPCRPWSRSAAPPAAPRTRPGLLPCRVHAFFRGLPGLWACLDPDCTEVDRTASPGRARSAQLYAQPQATCGCGARVFEFFTCRHCGSAYARGYTDDVTRPVLPLARAGRRLSVGRRVDPGTVALDLLLEEPTAGNVEIADLDLVTGRLNPRRTRRAKPQRVPADTTVPASRHGDDDEEEDGGRSQRRVQALRRLRPARRLRALVGAGSPDQRRPAVPGAGHAPDRGAAAGRAAYTDFAPLRGRKVLAFSDSRQVAARLAPNLQNYSMRDVIRPLILRGWSELAASRGSRASTQPGAPVPRGDGRRQAALGPAAPGTAPPSPCRPLNEVGNASTTGALDGDAAAADRSC